MECAALARRLGARKACVVALPAQQVMATVAQGFDVVSALSHESPLVCADLRAMGRQARAEGRPLVVDNTLTTFVGCPAVRLGAHMSVEPLEEGVTLVGLSGDAERALPGVGERLASLPLLEEDACVGLQPSLESREQRWRTSSDLAQVVAAYLVCHPHIAEVRYPGLRRDPSFEVAARTLTGGFGPFVDYRVVGDARWVRWEASEKADAREAVLALEHVL